MYLWFVISAVCCTNWFVISFLSFCHFCLFSAPLCSHRHCV
jgi:hypothetical protein